MNKVAIIVGNGKSRKDIQLETLKGRGTIFGCNALYRDFDGWDYLVAIDDWMIHEIRTTEKRLPGKFITPPEDERWEDERYSIYRRRGNAGMNAMLEAIRLDHNILYCIGFDFVLKDEDASVSNVYENTKNYGSDTKTNYGDNIHRIWYMNWFAKRNPKTTFVFVVPNNFELHPEFGAPNILGMKIEDFKKEL